MGKHPYLFGALGLVVVLVVAYLKTRVKVAT